MLVEDTGVIYIPASDNDWGRSFTYNKKGTVQEFESELIFQLFLMLVAKEK